MWKTFLWCDELKILIVTRKKKKRRRYGVVGTEATLLSSTENVQAGFVTASGDQLDGDHWVPKRSEFCTQFSDCFKCTIQGICSALHDKTNLSMWAHLDFLLWAHRCTSRQCSSESPHSKGARVGRHVRDLLAIGNIPVKIHQKLEPLKSFIKQKQGKLCFTEVDLFSY